MTDNGDELKRLIAEQEHDAKHGDRVWSLSLNAERDDGLAIGSMVTSDDGVVLKPRAEHRVKPNRWLVGHKERQRARKRAYGAICEVCGAVTDGSNGRAKAPKVCAQCVKARVKARAAAENEAAPHGTLRKYRTGCRCQPCRWEHARHAWDARERRLGRARP